MYVPGQRSSNSTGQPTLGNYAQRKHRPDYLLPILALLLSVLGLIVLFAISPALSAQKNVAENYFINRQFIAVGVSVLVFLAVSRIPLNTWQKIQVPLIATAAVASVAVRLLGEEVNGAYRWIQIQGLSFQAAELIKFALLIWMASFLATQIANNKLDDFKQTMTPLFYAFGLIGIVVAVIQSDLGSAAVMVAMMGVMGFVAGLPMKRIFLAGAVILMGLVIAVSSTPYRRQRLQTFLNPASDCQSTGYQTCQALIAVGSGGIFGLGLARSVQAYGYLPEAANDSIFAIFAEKFGFVGSALLIALFIALFTRILKIAERAPDDYTRLIAVGVLTWFSIQSIINIGAMVGVLPLKGITLPFISYGGTSLLFVSAALGLVFNISRYTSFRVSKSKSEQRSASSEGFTGRRGYGRSHRAAVAHSS